MSCCRKQANPFHIAKRAGAAPDAAVGNAAHPGAGAPVLAQFEYVGTTGLTTSGPVSGRHYRFDRPGARVTVDARDARALATVRNLRLVKMA